MNDSSFSSKRSELIEDQKNKNNRLTKQPAQRLTDSGLTTILQQ